ncbi:unnamed protein product [Oppiella nova]|uniref:Uncharacterized protein n=1 Tax=Oppiella nova TaxID=334625 RepID=A0A7R9M811_9ACAR|nr:unnamed protein product [Oppiella nova]CAG2172200.1 unnamed protein product [Oppiella nova]
MLLLPGFVLLVLTFVVTSGYQTGKTSHESDERPVDRCHQQIADCMNKAWPDFFTKVLKGWKDAHKIQSKKKHQRVSNETAHKIKILALELWMTKYVGRCIGETSECNGKAIVHCMAVQLTPLFDNTPLNLVSFHNTYASHASMVTGSISSCPLFTEDERNSPVDWYVVYKLPIVANQTDPLRTGLNYAYMTSNSQTGWILSSLNISDQESLFGQTLNQLNKTKLDPNVTYIYYNDQPPTNDSESTGAHAKGVIATDTAHGFWLMHTVPKFPPVQPGHPYVYPSNGAKYGQTALCISVNITQLDAIFTQMLVMQPK